MLSLVIGLSNLTNAQWTQTTGSSGGVGGFAIIGNAVFAASSDGVLMSTDNGDTWTLKNTGLTTTSSRCFATNGTVLFVGTTSGVYKSVNNATSWSISGVNSYSIRAMASDGDYIYAGTGGSSGSSQGVFRSTDNGLTWGQVNSGLTTLDVRALTVKGHKVFAGTYSTGGVFVSSDSGATWTAVNNGLPSQSISCLYSDGNAVYAGLYYGGVFVSTDDGANWSAINNGISYLFIRSVFANGNDIFVGAESGNFFMSDDNGATFTLNSTGLPTSYHVCAVIVSGNNLLAGTLSGSNGSGVFKFDLSTVGINSAGEGLAFGMFPNPATSDLFINCHQPSVMKLMDTQGKLIATYNLSAGKNHINTNSLQPGMYITAISGGDGIMYKKFIKQ